MTSSISGLSSSLIQSYERFQSISRLTTENMFQMLSLEIGDDGETITKEQLDTYIQEAQDGDISISNQELDALVDLQENWDAIAGEGAESITYQEMEDYRDILFSAVTGGISVSDSANSTSSSSSVIDDIDSYIINSTLLGLDGSNGETSTVNSILETLLSGNTDENDDDNANLIATLVNIIASYESNSTVELEV